MRTLTGIQGIGGAQELAEMLRQMGRGPDTMLAHITPKEAQMLLESGGSGRINPMTGLPEFQPEDFYGEGTYGADVNYEQPVDYSVQNVPEYDFSFPVKPADIRGMEGDQFERFTGQQPMFTGAGSLAPQDFQGFQYGPAPLQQEFVGQAPIPMVTAPAVERYDMGRGQLPVGPVAAQPSPYAITSSGVPQAAIPRPEGSQLPPPPQEKSFRQNYPMLSRLLAPTLASLPAAYFARQAAREGRGAERELRAMAQPIREQAEALRQQALSGGLTPQQARQQEARRAALRQSASQRGGTTGTQQAMIENTLTRERAGLAQTNLENAMRQLNLANTLTEAAIRARLASDRNVNQSLQNIYTNLIRTAAGESTTGQTQPPSQPEQLLQNERLIPQPTTAGGR